jgi:hypothetical protein
MKFYLVITNQREPIIVNELGAFIPPDDLNTDYLEYVAWLFEGNTPEEWQPETGVEN